MIERDQIARKIRALRRTRGLSIHKLANAAGISGGYLSEVERGHSAISGEKLARLAEELGVSTDYLLTGRSEHAVNAAIQIPPELSEAAKDLELKYAETLRLLAGKESLVAQRSSNAERQWTKVDWEDFYHKVKPYL